MLIHGSLGIGRELGWKEQDWRIQDKEAWGRGVCGPGGAGVMCAHCVACTAREHWPEEQLWIRGAPSEGTPHPAGGPSLAPAGS